MSIWFLLWLFLSGALLYFLGWILYILVRQKQAWKIFAGQKKLRFKDGSLMASPEMSGTVDNYPVSFFVGEHLAKDARASRKLTALEIKLKSKMPFAGAMASGGMVPLIQSMQFKDEVRFDHPQWDKNFIALSSSRLALMAYMNKERLDALTSLMRIRNGWVAFVFRDDLVLLRFDTPDPLETQEKLGKILQKMLSLAQILELKPGEEGLLKSEAAKKPPKEVSIAVDERDFKEAKTFELEDDDLPAEPKSEVPEA